MAVRPLSDDELTQLERHVNQLVTQNSEPAACHVADELLALYEERAGGIPETGRQTCDRDGEGMVLDAAEKLNLRTHVDALAVLWEDAGNTAANVSNEMLSLYETRAASVAPTNRDVEQAQLP